MIHNGFVGLAQVTLVDNISVYLESSMELANPLFSHTMWQNICVSAVTLLSILATEVLVKDEWLDSQTFLPWVISNIWYI